MNPLWIGLSALFGVLLGAGGFAYLSRAFQRAAATDTLQGVLQSLHADRDTYLNHLKPLTAVIAAHAHLEVSEAQRADHELVSQFLTRLQAFQLQQS
jgi:hypothetical protein